MRKALEKFANKTILLKFTLPHSSINKSSITTLSDCCLFASSENDLSKIIYYSIVDYCLNDSEIDITKLDRRQMYAIENRLRFEKEVSLDQQLKYGFFGEVLFAIILQQFFSTCKIIAKGYFYSPIERAENKGYDSFHFFQNKDGTIQLWFGEAKMYQSVDTAVKKVIESINKSLSKDYYERNVRAILNNVKNIDDSSCSILIREIEEKIRNEEFKLIELLKKYDVTMTYPILLVFDDQQENYEVKIQKTISYIEKHLSRIAFNNEIKAEILFIILPLNDELSVKKDVIKWIQKQEPMI